MHSFDVTVGFVEMDRREKEGKCIRCGKPASKFNGIGRCMRCERRENAARVEAARVEDMEIAARVAAIRKGVR